MASDSLMHVALEKVNMGAAFSIFVRNINDKKSNSVLHTEHGMKPTPIEQQWNGIRIRASNCYVNNQLV